MRHLPEPRRALSLALAALLLPAGGTAQEDPFAAGVRPTAPLPPREQREAFHLPEGFEIELVASEPEIAKPMNLAFDVRGRLWVSDSVEYPYAAPAGRPGRDAIRVIDDSDGDGRLDRVSLFADGLNIPIGLYPWRNGVVAWSIPNIWWIEDADGDGRADRKEVLYGPLGYERDTHGMSSSFNRGFDGWLYVTHGFNNHTTLRGGDGHEIRMHSGNVWRGRMDGSRVEHVAFGQVNPFGMAQDPLGDLYTSDCHSMPAWLILRGAFYPSFGKPHDGLGFCPPILAHGHGSTALDGVVHQSGGQWPAEYRDNLFIGNVMTSRVNRDALVEKGAGKQARKMPDFVRCDDPWFRPVHMKFGPDGALYIADFYNRIIGHYEVPLDHPGRDRRRGRIWRVSYTGEGPAPGLEDLARSPEALFEELGHPNLERRLLAMNHLVDEAGEAAVAGAHALASGSAASNWRQRVHSLWILHRLGRLPDPLLERARDDYSREVRVHLMRILSEISPWRPLHRELALTGLEDPDANVRRVAAEALARNPHSLHVAPLLRALAADGGADPFLRHACRIALRNQLRDEAVLGAAEREPLSRADARAVADVVLAIGSAPAAGFLQRCLERGVLERAQAVAASRHAARHGSPGVLEGLPATLEARAGGDLDLQMELHRGMTAGLEERGLDPPASAGPWSRRVGRLALERARGALRGWSLAAVPGTATAEVPWALQERASSDGSQGHAFLSSLTPGGEEHTGILRSPVFRLPPALSFFLAGHDGEPPGDPLGRNLVRLRLEEGAEVIAEAPAPRSDTAQKVEWDLSAHQGREAYLEIVDGISAWGYAWLAAGRLSPPVVPLPEASPREHAAQLVRAAALASRHPQALGPSVERLVADPSLAPLTRARMARELLARRGTPRDLAVALRLADPALTEAKRNEIASRLLSGSAPAEELERELWTLLPAQGQEALARDLAQGREGALGVLEAMEEGALSSLLLQDPRMRQQLESHGSELAGRVEALARNLPESGPESREAAVRILARIGAGEGDPRIGREVFEQACLACHQMDGRGLVVGPQLDGIASRGAERLLEDILAPSRNLDPAFRAEILSLEDGRTLQALHRRDEGALSVFADMSGAEIAVPRGSIASRRTVSLSLMPQNFLQALGEDRIADLVAFLLER